MRVQEIIELLITLNYSNEFFCEKIFSIFLKSILKVTSCATLGRLSDHFISFFTKPFHMPQADKKPNVIQTLLSSVLSSNNLLNFPPPTVKYLAKLYGVWFESILYLEKLSDCGKSSISDFGPQSSVRQLTHESLCDLYWGLDQKDYFYGLWRRRSIFSKTNTALSFEQLGLWSSAQNLYELAQIRARNGLLQFCESEFHLWENQWLHCAEKLQQWDALYDISKAVGTIDLHLKCAWRKLDWTSPTDQNSIKSLLDISKNNVRDDFAKMAKIKLIESFLVLNQISQCSSDKMENMNLTFHQCINESINLSLRKWCSLPSIVGTYHIPLLQSFQQIVELQEAQSIYIGINPLSMSVRQTFLGELQGIIASWLDRLPDYTEDIDLWSELLSWRQHVFGAINSAFQSASTEIMQLQGSNTVQHPSLKPTRWHHEMAWTINQFAHVARKHGLYDVCYSSLNKIFTFPIIEVYDAFMKLREQSKCNLKIPTETTAAIEILNATNMNYFVNSQKAELLTYKAMFLQKAGEIEEAGKLFSHAIQLDMNLPRIWAAWGNYNEYIFKETNNISDCSNALNCYLQAATLYKSHKSRRMICKILWLLSYEDSMNSLSKVFETYSPDLPTWYWVSFIPQLLTSLGRKEDKLVRYVLMKIVKSFPQAIYFPLRTSHEDFKTSYMGKHRKSENVDSPVESTLSTEMSVDSESIEKISTTVKSDASTPTVLDPPNLNGSKSPAEHADDLMAVVKTGYPLLVLSMENMVEHIIVRLRGSADEDIYRIISTLLYEAMQVFFYL